MDRLISFLLDLAYLLALWAVLWWAGPEIGAWPGVTILCLMMAPVVDYALRTDERHARIWGFCKKALAAGHWQEQPEDAVCPECGSRDCAGRL